MQAKTFVLETNSRNDFFICSFTADIVGAVAVALARASDTQEMCNRDRESPTVHEKAKAVST